MSTPDPRQQPNLSAASERSSGLLFERLNALAAPDGSGTPQAAPEHALGEVAAPRGGRDRLRFGLCTDQNLPWPTLRERWRYFESLGFDSLWDCDHFTQPSRPGGHYFESWTLLAALAAHTQRIRVGVLVSSITFRQPALLAHEALTVDHLSGGRLELGLGAGWYVPEHDTFGLAFPPPAERVGRFRESVEIVDALLRQAEPLTYTGRYYQLRDARLHPPPVQRPRPPLTLAAHGRQMLRTVARYADAWNSFGTVEEMRERGEVLDEQCLAIGRDPATLTRGLYGWAALMPTDPWSSPDAFVEMVDRYRAAGVNEFIIDQPEPSQFGVLERIAAETIPRLRG